MRTAVFLGLTAVADAINKNWLVDERTIKFVAIMVLVFMFMDIAEFIKKIRKNDTKGN
jgi:hypothetical protein